MLSSLEFIHGFAKICKEIQLVDNYPVWFSLMYTELFHVILTNNLRFQNKDI